MKKVTVIACALLLFFVSVSCSSTRSYSPVTEEEAAYSMNLAMTTAFENTISRLINATDSMQTVPPQYIVLETNRNLVPGLNAILNSWDAQIKDYFKSAIPQIENELYPYVSTLEFKDPLFFITSSDTSGSELFQKLYYDVVFDFCSNLAKNADYSVLESAVNQYNLYIKAYDFLYRTQSEKLEISDSSTYFTNLLTISFFNVLYSSEELYRTTPDPYKDRTAAVVFSVE